MRGEVHVPASSTMIRHILQRNSKASHVDPYCKFLASRNQKCILTLSLTMKFVLQVIMASSNHQNYTSWIYSGLSLEKRGLMLVFHDSYQIGSHPPCLDVSLTTFNWIVIWKKELAPARKDERNKRMASLTLDHWWSEPLGHSCQQWTPAGQGKASLVLWSFKKKRERGKRWNKITDTSKQESRELCCPDVCFA